MICFIVSSRDLFDRKKNPHLRLDVRYILRNKKIRKKVIK